MKKRLPISFWLYVFLAFATATLAPVSGRAGGVVTSPTEANLRAALADGGTVTFATSGTIYLSSVLSITSTTLIDAAGYAITISGSNATQVFFVNTNVQFTLNNLTVANGRTNQGAGMYNAGGAIVISNVTFASNQIIGATAANVNGESVYGGAVLNYGSLVLLDCRFWTNNARGGDGGHGTIFNPSGGDGVGGAIYNAGTIAITNCAFDANSAGGGAGNNGGSPGPAGAGGNALGGALWNQGGTVTISNCSFVLNVAGTAGIVGSPVEPGGTVQAGGLGNATGSVSIVASTFISNSISGLTEGAAIYHGGGTLSLSGSVIVANNAYGAPLFFFGNIADGSASLGGGLFNGATALVSDCTFASNNVYGSGAYEGLGAMANGGAGEGGGIANSGALNLLRCTLAGNTANAGSGAGMNGPGGIAYGGGVFNNGSSLSVVNCTLGNNVATGGMGAYGNGYPNGAGGNSYGGGIYATNGPIALTNCTLSGNAAVGGSGNTSPPGPSGTNGVGYGGNIAQSGVVELIETIVTAGVSNNAYGSLIDLGYNISSDASCAFSATGSLNNTDPKVQPLANNGGPTLTMALWPGSPAIDAGISLPGITTDQRGVTRPYGPAPDIGAYEWNGAPTYHSNFSLSSLSFSNGSWYVSGVGPTNQSFRVLVSSNLASWIGLSTNNTGPFGAYVVQDPSAPAPARFYKTISP